MTTQYTRSVLKMVVAQICQTIGWHSINSTPLEFMVDLMQEYIFQLSKLTQQYAQVLGRSEANLDDLGLAFRHLNIDLQELTEYVKNVDSVPCAVGVPKLPIPRDNHLNFLKPGSREVVTRPVHVHEHLPAMYPGTEDEYLPETKQNEIVNSTTTNDVANTSEDDSSEINVITTNGISSEESPTKSVPQAVFKRPGDPVSFDGPIVKRAKTTEEGRPLREIHSVIMTTSGFLSTAREGKLPEARTPQQARSESPAPPSYPMIPPEVKVEKKLKKIPKKVVGASEDGKPENKENKKKKIPKDTLFKPDEIKDVKVKKLAGMKELAKLKALKPGSKTGSPNTAGPSNPTVAVKAQGKIPGGSPKHTKNPVAPNKIKSEKLDVQNMMNPVVIEHKEESIDKLPIEPDKQKLNIFKKISSKPKEDKDKDFLEPVHKIKDLSPRDIMSPHLLMDDTERHRNDVIKQEEKKPIAQNQILNNNIARMPMSDDSVTNMMSPGSDVYMFDDMSPPGTPSTPKTPELSLVPNVSMEQKKKRKDKPSKKKEPKLKTPKTIISPKKARLSSDSAEINMLDRPKTPQAPEQTPPPRDSNLPASLPFPFFPPFPAAPGLIPHPMFPLPLHKGMQGIQGLVGPPNQVMPGMLRQRFFRPKLDPTRPLVPPSFVGETLHPPVPPSPVFPMKPPQPMMQSDKFRMKSPEKEMLMPIKSIPPPFIPSDILPASTTIISGGGLPAPLVPLSIPPSIPPPIPPVVPAPLLPPNLPIIKPPKSEKMEKSEKKLKEHKKEKKDKLKKKKEKKEKHKDKGERIKEKKDKSEKKEKLEKIKEKKEKKEKRKEKEASKKMAKEEKIIEGVPKITLKLGPAGGSPRPPTPDSALMKKITIKPPKKPEDEVKREPTPELARISALVTRPPKQKTTSKKAEEGLLEAYAAHPSGASYSSATLAPNPRTKKPVFKALREPSPDPSPYSESYTMNSLEPHQGTQYCFIAKVEAVPKKEDAKEDKENGGISLTAKSTVTVDQSGREIWICPACGKQDDGSPMIGCDDCDAWYHWVCVGIQVAPAHNEDWYCRLCIAKKQEQYHDKKKKKRKKKVKVSA